MGGYADGRFVMVALGLGEAFWTAPLLTPATRAPYERIGLDDFSTIYFAARSAPLGRVPVEVVTSTFFGFHPDKVTRYLPSVWERITPEQVIEAQRAVADETLRQRLGDWVGSDAARESADLVRAAAENGEVGGRPLFAGYASLPWPDPQDRHLVLWHGFTLLREYRGDAHIATLVANDIDPCECHLMMAAGALGGCECHAGFAGLGLSVDTETPPNPDVPVDREWPVVARRAALARLCERGLLRSDGTITPAGMDLHMAIERATDVAATSRWERRQGPAGAERLAELVQEPVRLLRSGWSLAEIEDLQST